MRRLAVLVLSAVAIACAPSPAGPARPVAQEQLGGADGIDVAAARGTALAFVHAYAESGTDGVAALRELVDGPDMRLWVRWFGIQNREFEGTIDAAADVRSAAFAALGRVGTSVGAQIDVSASVTFSYVPADGEAFKRTRILDGPMTLIRTGTADWRVRDVTRDGVSIDASITRFERQTQRLDGVSVRLDSVFRFVPNWQFNVVVTNDTRSTIEIDARTAALVVQEPDGVRALETTPTRSLAAIPPGERVKAIVSVPFQNSDRGRTLSLPFVSPDGNVRRFDFPLDGLVDPTPGPPTSQGSSTPAAG